MPHSAQTPETPKRPPILTLFPESWAAWVGAETIKTSAIDQAISNMGTKYFSLFI